jgi:hypothetical protein
MNTMLKNVLIQSARRYGCAATLGFGVILLFAMPCNGQSPSPGPIANNPTLGKHIPSSHDSDQTQMDSMGGTPAFYEKRLQMLNAAQHQSMVADTERLVKLVADLNAQINSSNASSLTPEQMRMVAEIEKLAHNVRDKMRMTVRSAANVDVNPTAPFIPR